MILKLFSVFDSKVEAYMQPFFMASRGAAIRAFIDTASDSNSMICKHPGDYTLFELGSFDDSCAKFDLYSSNVNLGNALDIKD